METGSDERVIVEMWERQAFKPSDLDALGLRVVFRGVPSDAGGPDYQDAILSARDRRLLTGDIEFHVNAGDWYVHGHHLNPQYNRVILHVVWTGAAEETRRHDGVLVPVLALQGGAPASWPGTNSGSMHPLMPHPCIAGFEKLSTEALLDEVRRLGLQRFDALSSRFAADLAIEDPDQVAYGALLEGLGYASNRRAFAQLADAVPYAWLLSLRPEERLASVLDAARLGPSASVPPPARLPLDSWRLARLRPANHPARRLHGIVLLLARLGPSLAGALVDVVNGAKRPSHLRGALVVPGDNEAAIGSGRADELAASIVLPFVDALDPASTIARMRFEAYPAPPANRWTRHMLGLMQEAGHDVQRVRTAPEHQGLHHLYHAYCRTGTAKTCSVCQAPSSRE